MRNIKDSLFDYGVSVAISILEEENKGKIFTGDADQTKDNIEDVVKEVLNKYLEDK